MNRSDVIHTFRIGKGRAYSLRYDTPSEKYQCNFSFGVTEFLSLDELNSRFGLMLIPKSRFINVRQPQAPLWLPYDIAMQEVLWGHKWLSVQALQEAGIRHAPEIQQLPPAHSRFGAEPKGAGFVSTKYSRGRRK